MLEDSKVGNFCEVKKSVVGIGSKINHLAYVGDATIGEKANIGAGTITCNYDGINKHQTIIGDNVFVGSNSSLIAPVEIGSNAIIAAGSVVTKDVPANTVVAGNPARMIREMLTTEDTAQAEGQLADRREAAKRQRTERDT